MPVKEILYFDTSSRDNTEEGVKFAIKRMEELGIKHVVIAWSSGATTKIFQEAIKSSSTKPNVVVVTNPSPHSPSRGVMPMVITPRDSEFTRKWKEEKIKQGITELSVTIQDDQKEELEKQGLKVCYLTDDFLLGEPLALGGKQMSSRAKLANFGLRSHVRPLDMDSGRDLSLLTIISQGFRVCVGCTSIATRNEFIPEGETVLAIAGLCTALVLRAGSTVMTTIVKEIVSFERGSSHYERDPEHPEGD
jgi:hypothetical protein